MKAIRILSSWEMISGPMLKEWVINKKMNMQGISPCQWADYNNKYDQESHVVVDGVVKTQKVECLLTTKDKIQMWHIRFSHVDHKTIRTMQHRHMVDVLPKIAGKTTIRKTCVVGKQQREAIYNKTQLQASERLQLIHTALCGPITPVSQGGKSYALDFIDDFTRKLGFNF